MTLAVAPRCSRETSALGTSDSIASTRSCEHRQEGQPLDSECVCSKEGSQTIIKYGVAERRLGGKKTSKGSIEVCTTALFIRTVCAVTATVAALPSGDAHEVSARPVKLQTVLCRRTVLLIRAARTLDLPVTAGRQADAAEGVPAGEMVQRTFGWVWWSTGREVN